MQKKNNERDRIWIKKSTKKKVDFLTNLYDVTIYNLIETLVSKEYNKTIKKQDDNK